MFYEIQFFTIIDIFLLKISFSQERFNIIIENTVSHISNGIVEQENNYYMLSEYTNEQFNVIMCISKINEFGETEWQKSYENGSMIIRSGWSGSLKKLNDGFYLCGTAILKNSNMRGIHQSQFDSNFELIKQKIYLYDTVWKACFNSVSDVNGSTYVCGQYLDTIEDVGQLYVAKITEQDSLKWLHLTNTAYSYASKLLKHSNGDIYAGGAINYSGISDWYIIKTDTAGNLVWEKNFGFGSRNDGAVSALAETPDSCIIACGSYPGIQTMTDTYYDGCIRKIDKNGELVWEKLYRSYLLSHTGSVYTTNHIYSIISDNETIYAIGKNYNYNSWLDRAFLLKLNKYGEIIWKRNYFAANEESHSQQIATFKQTSDGGFILSGYGNDYSNIGYDPPQQRWLIKTDSLGMDGLCNTEPDVLEVDIDLPDEMCAFDTTEVYLHIAGPTAPYTVNISNGQIFDSIYYPPVFVPKEIGPSTIEISYDGITIMEFEEPEVTISNHDWGECIAIPIEYHVGNQVGFVNLDITVTDGWGNSKTTSKLVFIKTCPDGMNDISLNQLQIYPNPASNSITIDLSNNHRSLKADIFDAQGKHVLSTNITGEQTTIDIRSLPAGSYQFVIEKTSHNFTVVK